MEFLGPPDFTSVELYDTVVRGLRDRQLAAKYEREQPLVASQVGVYRDAARAGSLSAIAAGSYSPTAVTVAQLEDLYRRLRKNPKPRRLYDELVERARFKRCAYCSDRTAATLDHYLPLKKYSAFAVLALNLVPVCHDCNIQKGAFEQSGGGALGASLHPYFDDVSTTRWLRAVIVNPGGLGPVARFYVDGASITNPALRARAAQHLRALDLRTHFKTKAAQEIAGLDDRLPRMRLRKGRESVVAELFAQADQRSHNRLNSWERAFFEALADDSWYLDEHLAGLALVLPDDDPRRPIAL